VKVGSNARSGLARGGRKIIEPLEADEPPTFVRDEDQVVVPSGPHSLRIAESDAQRVRLVVVADRHLFCRSFPVVMFLVR